MLVTEFLLSMTPVFIITFVFTFSVPTRVMVDRAFGAEWLPFGRGSNHHHHHQLGKSNSPIQCASCLGRRLSRKLRKLQMRHVGTMTFAS